MASSAHMPSHKAIVTSIGRLEDLSLSIEISNKMAINCRVGLLAVTASEGASVGLSGPREKCSGYGRWPSPFWRMAAVAGWITRALSGGELLFQNRQQCLEVEVFTGCLPGNNQPDFGGSFVSNTDVSMVP